MSFTVALIGVSGFARFHYENLMELAAAGTIHLVAATIVNREQEAAKCQSLRKIGCEIFLDYREMLAQWQGRIELCVIPTAIHQHAPMTIAALAAGCNVLVEKPAAGSLQDVDAMREAEARSGRFVAVGFQQIYARETWAAKEALLSGLIGRILCFKGLGLWPRSNLYYRRNNWAGKLKQAGLWVLDSPFNNAFAHPLNLLCFLAGEKLTQSAVPRRIQAELYRARSIESLDTACLRVDFGRGRQGLLWHSHSCPQQRDGLFEVRGEYGSLVWTQHEILHRTASGTKSFQPVSDFFESGKVMLRTVLDRLTHPATFVCGLEIARTHTLCSNGAIDASPITTIDPRYLSTHLEGLDHRPVINGIEEACELAFEEEKLWSELAIPWARPSRELDLESYSHFQGRYFLPVDLGREPAEGEKYQQAIL